MSDPIFLGGANEAREPVRVDQHEAARRSPVTTRLWISAVCLSAWLLFLFVGVTLGGAIHLLLLVVLWQRPWRLPAESRPKER